MPSWVVAGMALSCEESYDGVRDRRLGGAVVRNRWGTTIVPLNMALSTAALIDVNYAGGALPCTLAGSCLGDLV